MPGRWLLGALGLATAFGGLIVALLAPAVAGDVALRRELAERPVVDRTVTVVSTDSARGATPDVNAFVRDMLSRRGMTDVLRLTSVRQLPTPDGGVYRLVGVDDLSARVKVVSGRLPRRCDADVCEAVLWRRAGTPDTLALATNLRVTIVGSVERTDARVLSGTFTPEDRDAVVFVDGAESPSSIVALDAVDRSTGWIAAIDFHSMSIARVPAFLQQLATLGDRNDVAHLVVTGPDDAVRDVARRARITVNRLALPVGEAGALLAGFAVIATFAVRPWHRRGLQVLRLRSASRLEEWRFCIVEGALLVIVGAVIGVVVGGVGIAVIAALAHVATGSALAGIAGRRVLVPFAALIAFSFVATVTILKSSEPAHRSLRRLRISDALGMAAVAVWVFASSRGRATADTLASRSDPLISITPALAGIAAAALAIRVLPILGALGKRVIPPRQWAARLAVADSPRRRLRSMSTVAFVTASLTMATFALGYRTTLQMGSVDQAAFAVPLDFTLREGPKLITPQHLRPPDTWSTMVPGTFASNVLRRSLSVRTTGTAADAVQVLGVRPETLDRLRVWRSDFGSRPQPASIAEPPLADVGAVLNSFRGNVTLTTSALPADIDVALVLQRADGTWHESVAAPDQTHTRWTVELNPFDDDVRLVGFRIGDLRAGGLGGGSQVKVTDVDAVLQSVVSDAGDVAVQWGSLWSATAKTSVEAANGGARVLTTIHGTTDLIYFGRPLDEPLAAIVDPTTASTAVAGLVTLEVDTGGTVKLRVAGVASSFPTVSTRFAVVDEATLSAVLDRVQPGMGAPNEMWLAAADAAALARLRSVVASNVLDDLDRVDRTALEARLSGDTLGKSVMVAFLVSSLASALLGAMALVFVARSDRVDELDALRGLRSIGASPAQLSRMLTTRAALLLATAAPVGIGCGVILLDGVRNLISVSASGTAPTPRLREVIEPTLIVWLVAGVAAVSLAGVALIGRSLRSIGRHDAFAGGE